MPLDGGGAPPDTERAIPGDEPSRHLCAFGPRYLGAKPLIRRSMEHVRSVRRNPYPLVSVPPGVRNRRPGPAPSGQSVRKL